MFTLKRNTATALLLVFCVVQCAGVLGYLQYFLAQGYLPAPFVYDKSDTFMDFFNVAFWSDYPTRYTDWGSVYPPINFIFARLAVTISSNLSSIPSALEAREIAPESIAVLVALYMLVPAAVLMTKPWRTWSILQRVLAYGCITLSPIHLFALERGNLIIFSLLLVALALARPGVPRMVALGILINVKPYCALLLLTYAVKRQWTEGLCATIIAGVVFLVTGLLLDQNFPYFFVNLLSFGQSESVFSGREVLALPSSISAFAYLLNLVYTGGATANVSGVGLDRIALVFSIVNGALLLGTASALGLYGRRLSDEMIIVILLVFISNLGVWVGGYSMLVYPAMIPILMKARLGWLYTAIVGLMLLPLDSITLLEDPIGKQHVFLSGLDVKIMWQLGLGTALRPLLNIAFLLLLTLDLIAQSLGRGVMMVPDADAGRGTWIKTAPASS